MKLPYIVIQVSLDICDHVYCMWYFFRHLFTRTIPLNTFSDYWRNKWKNLRWNTERIRSSSYCRNSVTFSFKVVYWILWELCYNGDGYSISQEICSRLITTFVLLPWLTSWDSDTSAKIIWVSRINLYALNSSAVLLKLLKGLIIPPIVSWISQFCLVCLLLRLFYIYSWINQEFASFNISGCCREM